jgi:hypothetical protein
MAFNVTRKDTEHKILRITFKQLVDAVNLLPKGFHKLNAPLDEKNLRGAQSFYQGIYPFRGKVVEDNTYETLVSSEIHSSRSLKTISTSV